MDLEEPFLWDSAEILRGLGFSQGAGDFQASWEERNPWNIPGPIYVGEDDACGLGPLAAPNNVYEPVDTEFVPEVPYGGEFVFRQPSTLFELRQIVGAAATNTMSAYALDGNDHWTRQGVAAWWDSMQLVRSASRRLIEAYESNVRTRLQRRERPWPEPSPSAGLSRWIDYLENGAETYLRKYVAFLDSLHPAR